MKALVCGGRTIDDLPFVDGELDRLHKEHHFTGIVTGDATGVDQIAYWWAGASGVPVEMFHARWKQEGRKAGPLRNQRMLDTGKPDIVIAFPGGRGTADMVRRATASGVRVINIIR